MSTAEQNKASQVVIAATGLRKRFGDVNAVDGIDLAIVRGEIFGFLGPNGSGKTTLLRMLCGLLSPDSGTGHSLNIAFNATAPLRYQRQRKIGYLAQQFTLYDDLTVLENLQFRARIFSLNEANRTVAEALTKYKLHEHRNHAAGQLSGGWRRRLEMAACLLHRPELLLLDEPTAGVDAAARNAFWIEITELVANGSTVLLNTHDISEAERCDRIAYLSRGRIVVSGNPQALIKQARISSANNLNLQEALSVLIPSQEVSHEN